MITTIRTPVNFRDLGGLVGYKGKKIVPNRIYRGGQLFEMSDSEKRMKSGDVVYIAPEIKHWHCAVTADLKSALTSEETSELILWLEERNFDSK